MVGLSLRRKGLLAALSAFNYNDGASRRSAVVYAMKPLLYAALAGYVIAAIHAVLSFVNKRRAAERIAFYSVIFAFAAHTGPLVFERGKGVYIYDTEGKPYLEGMAGLWCTALGYDNEELVQAATEQMRKLPFAHLFTAKSHDPAIELAERLKELLPLDASRILFCSSGSEANDTQVKLVWYMNNALARPQKKKIISRLRAYHGVTIAAASLTGLPQNHRDFDLPIAGILHTGCPHHYRFAHPGYAPRNDKKPAVIRDGGLLWRTGITWRPSWTRYLPGLFWKEAERP